MIGIGWTLGRYFGRRFTQWILGVFLTVFGLIYLLDFVEFLRRSGDTKGATVSLIAVLSLYRTPVIAEQVMPFAVMFGSIGAFLALSRKLELVVTRAAGVSVWQFAFPALLVAGLGGVAVTTLYDPGSALLKQRADAIEAKFIGSGGAPAASKSLMWIRQRAADGQAIIRVKFAADGGATLKGVTIFQFDNDGRFKQRVEAEEADLRDGYWLLRKARVLVPGVVPQDHAEYKIATTLKIDQLRQTFLPPENVPFWQLPRIVAELEVAGLDATRYRLRYDKLIAQPVMFIAMVLVAATVSLRFFRFGGVASMVLAGVMAGFVLYVASELVEDLGAAGIVGPGVAAWLPATVGMLLGVLSLLHQEDGVTSFRIGASRIGPRVGGLRLPRQERATLARVAAFAGLCLVGCGMFAIADAKTKTPAATYAPAAPDQNDRNAQKTAARQANGQADMLVEAKELVYDKNKNTVSAVGDAKIYYQGRVLQADKVVYYRDQKRVLAEGNAKLTDEDGNVYFGKTFELTNDFKSGFINSLLVETKDKTRFSSPRAERAEGETTTFEDGTYSACEPCKDDPSKPPLWQVRAKRIIDNHDNHRIYYEDAWLQFYGWPVAYMPYFSAPDPSVRRATGLLAPIFYGGSKLGIGVGIPFFWNLAPNYDLTFTPNFLSQQGFLGQVEWRQRLETGSYSIRLSGIDEADPKAFPLPPYGSADKNFRGSIETSGKFYLNENWWTGWDVSAATDKFFFYDYKIRNNTISALDYNYLREATSSVYLTGKAGRSWFDLRGFYFETLSALDYQKQIPVAAPVLDYDRRFDGPGFLGGEVTLNANAESIHRTAGDFVDTFYRGNPLSPNYVNTYLFNTANLPPGSPYGNLYNACAVYSKGTCIVRGLPGDYSRASVDLSWRRRIIDDIGEVWTPFAYLKTQASFTNVDQSGYNNANIANFISPDQGLGTRAMPAVGLEYRYPFVATSSWGTSVIEPVGEIVARPNELRIGQLANEDAQSLVFDDTTLFEADKFSGYDRMEGGTRANLGVQYTFTTKGGGYYNALIGESYQVAGANSYAVGDLTNTGLDSGLETKRSDFVGRIVVQPAPWFSTTARGRFDESTFASERLEITSTFAPFQAVDLFADNKSLRSISLSGTYAHIAAQPDLAQPYRRDALSLGSTWNVYGDWSIGYGIVFDLSHHLDPDVVFVPSLATNVLHYSHGLFAPAANTLTAQYHNDCCTFKAQYVTGYQPSTFGVRVKNETVLFTLELRTLGAINYSSNVSGLVGSTDGIGGR